MSNSANIRSIQTLRSLASALKQYRAESEIALESASREIEETTEWIKGRIRHWQIEVQKGQETVRRAQTALRACEASGYRDKDGNYHAPNCRAQQYALQIATKKLRECQRELENAQKWNTTFQRAQHQYEKQAHKFRHHLSSNLPKSVNFLNRKTSDLNAYAFSQVLAQAFLAKPIDSGNIVDVTWSERQNILEKAKQGIDITQDEFDKLLAPPSDLIHGTLQPDNLRINSSLLDSERWYELTRELWMANIPEATWESIIKSLIESLALTSKYKQFWRNESGSK